MRIAISSLSGCGNTTVSRMVAEKLKLKFINYTFRNLSKDLGLPFKKVQKDSEKTTKYDYEVDRRQAALIRKAPNCVAGSRLAVWLDDDRLKDKIGTKAPPFDFKAWIYAPLNERAKRVANREKKPVSVVLQETLERDDENEQRYMSLYGVNVKHFARAVDVTVNTERFQAEQVAELIVAVAKKAKAMKKGRRQEQEPGR